MHWVPKDTWVAITCGPVWALLIIGGLAVGADVRPGVVGFLVTYGLLIALERLHKELQLRECRLQRRLAAELALCHADHESS